MRSGCAAWRVKSTSDCCNITSTYLDRLLVIDPQLVDAQDGDFLLALYRLDPPLPPLCLLHKAHGLAGQFHDARSAGEEAAV